MSSGDQAPPSHTVHLFRTYKKFRRPLPSQHTLASMLSQTYILSKTDPSVVWEKTCKHPYRPLWATVSPVSESVVQLHTHSSGEAPACVQLLVCKELVRPQVVVSNRLFVRAAHVALVPLGGFFNVPLGDDCYR